MRDRRARGTVSIGLGADVADPQKLVSTGLRGGLFLAKRFARHASALTTVVYTHPSDEEMFTRLRDLPC